jgi:hypothetical protein
VIRSEAFERCRSLQSLQIVGSVSTIEGGFLSRSKVCEIRVDEDNRHFERIGEFLIAKEGPSVLLYFGDETEIVIPSGIVSLEADSFYRRFSVGTVIFEGGSKLTSIEREAFAQCGSLRSIRLPASLEVIGERAFFFCESLAAISFETPSRLSRIGREAFSRCASLTSITFPGSLVSMEGLCFGFCQNSRSVICESGAVPEEMHWDAFGGCPNLDMELLRTTGRT